MCAVTVDHCHCQEERRSSKSGGQASLCYVLVAGVHDINPLGIDNKTTKGEFKLHCVPSKHIEECSTTRDRFLVLRNRNF